MFDEVEKDKSGSIGIDELLYYFVDKMSGLPYTYRTQINQSLRRVYKYFETEGQQGLDRMTFWEIMQFIFYWFLI